MVAVHLTSGEGYAANERVAGSILLLRINGHLLISPQRGLGRVHLPEEQRRQNSPVSDRQFNPNH
jgi:hypothetical protein